jgi:hypothetical protein
MIGRSRSYRDIANRDFAISDVEVFVSSISRSPIFRWRVPFGTFPDFLICATRPQQMDGRDLSSRFRDMICPGPLVSRIREMPNPEKPMNSLDRDFSRKLRSLPRVLNRWTARFASGISLERNPITCSQVSRFSESRYADGAFLFGTFSESPDLRHASLREMDGPDSASGYRDLRCSKSLST